MCAFIKKYILGDADRAVFSTAQYIELIEQHKPEEKQKWLALHSYRNTPEQRAANWKSHVLFHFYKTRYFAT